MTKPNRPAPEQLPRPVGRPSNVTALLNDSSGKLHELLSYLKAGATLRTACRATDLDYEKVGIWLDKGRSQVRGNYKVFREKVLQSVGEGCLVAEIAIRERDPKAYIKAASSMLGESSPYETAPVPSITPLPSQSNVTFNIIPVLQEWQAAGLSIEDILKGLTRTPNLPPITIDSSTNDDTTT